MFWSWSFAPLTTAPLGSVTVPVMAAEKVCAMAAPLVRTARRTPKRLRYRNRTDALFLVVSRNFIDCLLNENKAQPCSWPTLLVSTAHTDTPLVLMCFVRGKAPMTPKLQQLHVHRPSSASRNWLASHVHQADELSEGIMSPALFESWTSAKHRDGWREY